MASQLADLSQIRPRESAQKTKQSTYLAFNLFSYNNREAHPFSILQVPTTLLAKMSIDLKFVELTADVLDFSF